jgi:hypothetical protein
MEHEMWCRKRDGFKLLEEWIGKVTEKMSYNTKWSLVPKYHMRILLGDSSAKEDREDIFKLTIGNKCLHEISNDNGVRLVNFATSKNLRVKSTMFPHCNIHKYTWTSPDGKTHNQIDHILIDRRRHSNVHDV